MPNTKIPIRGTITTNDRAWLYDYFGMDYTSPKTVAAALEEAGGQDVVLDINSPGGVVVAGYEIYNALAEYPGRVTAKVGYAMSMATVIACAADEVLISDVGAYMIHNTQGAACGDYRVLDSASNALKTLNAGIINAYRKKTGLGADELKAMMDECKWMTGEEAVENHFADGIIGEDEEDGGNALDLAASAAPVFAHDKAMELAQIMAIHLAAGPEGDKDAGLSQETTKEESMTLDEFLAQNPEAAQEAQAKIEEARNKGAEDERARLKELDAIAAAVPKDALENAKYGDEPKDAKTLAFEVMADNAAAGSTYMAAAMADAAASEEVGTFEPESGESQADESDSMASYVNAKKGACK